MSTLNKKTSGVLKLQDIVDDVLNSMGVYDESEYLRYLKFAIKGMTKLSLFHLNTVEIAYLDVSDNNLVELPSDYVDYVKIGICVNGNIWTLGVNKKMCLTRTESCGLRLNEALQDPTNEQLVTNQLLFVDGTYGLGGGYNVAYYRIDKEMGNIQLAQYVPNSQIVLEYISTGISAKGTTLVPVQAREAIEQFIHWKRKENSVNPKFTMNEIMMSKQEYLEEVEELRSFENMFTLDEMMDIFYQSWKQTVKR